MSVNVFFTAVLVGLVAMFGYFKPLASQLKTGGEVPKIEMESFVIYEIAQQGLERFFEGKEGKKFEDRYEISSAKFSNNSKELFESVNADYAHYKDDFITLNGNVHYAREDGLEFRSDEGTYDQKNSIIRTEKDFVLTQKKNRVDGTKLYYNIDQDTVSADAIRGSYQLN